MTASPARRWILSAVVAAVLVAAAIIAARAIRDDAPAHDTSARHATTSSEPTTAPPSTTTPATTTPATTNGVPATTTRSGATTTGPSAPPGPPGPCGADTGAIRAVVGTVTSGADLSSCRLAASDPSWAAARAGTTIVVLHRDAGAWTVVAQGGTDAGCGRAPQQVIVDLGQFCVGTGGGAS